MHEIGLLISRNEKHTWGCMVDAMESYVPLSVSPICSVSDFWESGCTTGRQCYRTRGNGDRRYLHGGRSLVGERLPASVGHGGDTSGRGLVWWYDDLIGMGKSESEGSDDPSRLICAVDAPPFTHVFTTGERSRAVTDVILHRGCDDERRRLPFLEEVLLFTDARRAHVFPRRRGLA